MHDPAPPPVTPPASARPPGLAVHTELRQGIFVVSVHGDVDIGTVKSLRDAAAEAVAAAPAAVLVDLGACAFIDSSALQVLIALRQTLTDEGRALAVTPGPPQVQRVFDVSGLAGHFFAAADQDGQVVSNPPSTGSSTPVT